MTISKPSIRRYRLLVFNIIILLFLKLFLKVLLRKQFVLLKANIFSILNLRNKDVNHKLKLNQDRLKNMNSIISLSLSISNVLKIKQRNRRIFFLWILRETGEIKGMRRRERPNQKVQLNINQSTIYLLVVLFILRIKYRLYHHQRDKYTKILNTEIENMRNIICCRHLINRKNQKRV